MESHTVCWPGAKEEVVSTIDRLDALLDHLTVAFEDESPTVVIISGPLGFLTIGVSDEQSVLTFSYADSEPPHFY